MRQSLTSVAQRTARNQPNMIWKIFPIFGLGVVVLGNNYPTVSEYKVVVKHPVHHGHHGKLSHVGSNVPEHQKEYAWTYPSYEYSYHVDDPHTHDQKGQHETRHGDEVKGMYWLIQPDGRKRTVKYHADKHSGFKADVEYSEPIYDVHHEKHEHHHKDKSHDKPVSEQHVIIHYDHKEQSEDNQEKKHEEKHEEKHEDKHEEHHGHVNMEDENKDENDSDHHEHGYYVHENQEPEHKRVIEYYQRRNNEYHKDYQHDDESDNNEDEQRIYHKHHILIDHKYKPYHHDDNGYYYSHKYE